MCGLPRAVIDGVVGETRLVGSLIDSSFAVFSMILSLCPNSFCTLVFVWSTI